MLLAWKIVRFLHEKLGVPIIPRFVRERFYELLVWVVGGLLLLVIFFVVRERYLKKMIKEVRGKMRKRAKKRKKNVTENVKSD